MEHSTDLASTGAQLELLPIHISSSRRTNTSTTRHLDLREQGLNHWGNMVINIQVRQKERGWVVLLCQLFASVLIKEVLHKGNSGTQTL